jgi:hypothetical protein
VPLVIKSFVLYFLFIILPLTGIVLYLILLALEWSREEKFDKLRVTFARMAESREPVSSEATPGRPPEPLVTAPLPETAAGDKADKELEEIKEILKIEEAKAKKDGRMVELYKKKMEKTSPHDVGNVISALIQEDK